MKAKVIYLNLRLRLSTWVWEVACAWRLSKTRVRPMTIRPLLNEDKQSASPWFRLWGTHELSHGVAKGDLSRLYCGDQWHKRACVNNVTTNAVARKELLVTEYSNCYKWIQKQQVWKARQRKNNKYHSSADNGDMRVWKMQPRVGNATPGYQGMDSMQV